MCVDVCVDVYVSLIMRVSLSLVCMYRSVSAQCVYVVVCLFNVSLSLSLSSCVCVVVFLSRLVYVQNLSLMCVCAYPGVSLSHSASV